jgi:hypothetical protein
MKHLFILSILSTVLLNSCVKEQAISLSGVVRNYITNETMKNTPIYVSDHQGYFAFFPRTQASAVTDQDGKFNFNFSKYLSASMYLSFWNLKDFNKLNSHRLVLNGFPNHKNEIVKDRDYGSVDDLEIDMSYKDMLIEVQPYIRLTFLPIENDTLSLEYIYIPEFDLKLDSFPTATPDFYLFLEKFESNTAIFIKHQNKTVIKQRLDYDYFKEGFRTIDVEI